MSGRGKATVGYIVQCPVDMKHHLIITHEVTYKVHDRTGLSSMSHKTREIFDKDEITVIVHRDYYSGEEIKACEESGITTYLPRPLTSGNRKKGRYSKRDFIYKPENDEYECPAGERAIYRCSKEDRGKVLKNYWSLECIRCKI